MPDVAIEINVLGENSHITLNLPMTFDEYDKYLRTTISWAYYCKMKQDKKEKRYRGYLRQHTAKCRKGIRFFMKMHESKKKVKK